MVRLKTTVFYSLSICLFLLFFLIGCEKRIANSSDSDIHSDSLEYYMKEAYRFDLENKKRDEHCKKALLLLKYSPLDSVNLKEKYRVALRYFNMDSIERYYGIVNETLKESIIQADTLNMARGYEFMGVFYDKFSKEDSSFYYLKKACDLYTKEKKYNKASEMNNLLAQSYYNIGDLFKAEEKIVENIKFFKISDNELRALSLGLMGNILQARKEYDASLDYYEKALKIIEKDETMKDRALEPHYYNNIGNVFRQKNDFNKAKEYFEKVKSYKRTPLIDSVILSITYRNLGRMYLDNNNLKGAIDNLEISKNIEDRNSNKVLKVWLLFDYSDYYLKLNDTLSSKKYALESLSLSKEIKKIPDVKESLKQLIKVDSENAAYYTNEYIRISDSLDLVNNTLKYKFSRIEFETDEIIREKEKAVHDKWLIASIAILVIALGSLLYIIRWQRTKQKELVMINNQQKASEEIYKLILDQQIKFDEGREKEKKRIARELHDGIMNNLAGIRYNLFRLEKKRDDETIDNCLNYIAELHTVEKEIRNIAHDLDMDVFSPKNDYASLLNTLVRENEQEASYITLEVQKEIVWESVSSIIKMNCYRILQECFNNIKKHSQATEVNVQFQLVEEHLILEVSDNGLGFDLKKQNFGLGLSNIKERVRILKGTFDIYSEMNKFTRIKVNIPL